MDPPPTPTANPVSSSVMTPVSPPKLCRAMTGNSARKVAPMAQNQDRPRMLSHTARLARAVRSRASVSRGTFQPMRSPGAAGAERGTSSAAARPSTAMASPAAETMAGPSCNPISTPPAMVPARMAPNVPASIRALPDSSSASRNCSGRMPYFRGPKNAACTPRPNSTANRAGTLPDRKPQAARARMTASNPLVSWISRDLSSLSANWPAMAENRA